MINVHLKSTPIPPYAARLLAIEKTPAACWELLLQQCDVLVLWKLPGEGGRMRWFGCCDHLSLRCKSSSDGSSATIWMDFGKRFYNAGIILTAQICWSITTENKDKCHVHPGCCGDFIMIHRCSIWAIIIAEWPFRSEVTSWTSGVAMGRGDT